MIKINSIDKYTKKRDLFEATNLELKLGYTYLMKGENGIGKTSLLNILYKLDFYCEKEILVNQKNLDSFDDSNLRQEYISYFSQQNNLLGKFTLKENLAILLENYNKDEYEKLVEKFNFKTLENKKIIKLSGGEKQKAQLILIFLKEAPIYFFDEPFNNLDKESKLICMNEINALNEEDNKLIIIVAHDIPQDLKYEGEISIENNELKIKNLELIQSKKKDIAKKNKYLTFAESRKFLKVNIFKFLPLLLVNIFIVVLLIFVNSKIQDTLSGLDDIMKPTTYDDVVIIEKTSKTGIKNTFFSQEEIDSLEELEGVKEAEPVSDNGGGVYDDKTPDGNQLNLSINVEDLEYENFESEDGYQLNMKNIKQNSPMKTVVALQSSIKYKLGDRGYEKQSAYNFDGLIFGDFPKDHSNKIMIDENLAIYYMQQQEIDDMEELVGTEIAIPTYKVDDRGRRVGEDYNQEYEISGIYKTLGGNYSNVIFGYTGQMASQGNLIYESYNDKESAYNIYKNSAETKFINEDIYSFGEFEETVKDGYYRVLLVLNDSSYVEAVTRELEEKYPDNKILSKDTFLYQKEESVYNSIKSFLKNNVLIISLILLVINILFSYSYLKLKRRQIKTLKYYGVRKVYRNFLLEYVTLLILSLCILSSLIFLTAYPTGVYVVMLAYFLLIQNIAYIIAFMVAKKGE